MPFIIAAGIIIWISIAAIRKSSKLSSLAGGPDDISDAIEEHPFTLNPIIWVILTATIFISIMIFYYATSFI